MGDRIGMSISADSPSDETLNQGPLALLLLRQYEFPFGINIVQFSIYLVLEVICENLVMGVEMLSITTRVDCHHGRSCVSVITSAQKTLVETGQH